ncbi:hypothetical protein WKH27_01255 [Pantoea agglomerans]|uniref:hypothetical protein n=1 Tax=Enterobacter agglomerans TaxID=549 RepID=UPI00289DBE67|nr:hypothetical protein [Pantoea agglomerans]WNK54853.1 hypothetical protein RM154_07395 [Pantoea agglomerans]
MSFSLMPLQVLMADRVRTAVPGPMAVRVKMEDEGETGVSEEMEGLEEMVVPEPMAEMAAWEETVEMAGTEVLDRMARPEAMAGMEEAAVWGEMAETVEMEGMAAMVVLVAQGGTEGMVAAREVTAVREVTGVTGEMAATKFTHALISLLPGCRLINRPEQQLSRVNSQLK